MDKITRTSQAEWLGNLRDGKGQITSESAALSEAPYSYSTRFGDQPGTNPEELIAAAHAACYSMALASTLNKKGFHPSSISTRAVCQVEASAGGHKITQMQLTVVGKVSNLDQETFKKIAEETHNNCPVSNLLKGNIQIHTEAMLLEPKYSSA